jgi:hypothetical protein
MSRLNPEGHDGIPVQPLTRRTARREALLEDAARARSEVCTVAQHAFGIDRCRDFPGAYSPAAMHHLDRALRGTNGREASTAPSSDVPETPFPCRAESRATADRLFAGLVASLRPKRVEARPRRSKVRSVE